MKRVLLAVLMAMAIALPAQPALALTIQEQKPAASEKPKPTRAASARQRRAASRSKAAKARDGKGKEEEAAKPAAPVVTATTVTTVSGTTLAKNVMGPGNSAPSSGMTNVTLLPVEHLLQNPTLAERVRPRLPAGTELMGAAKGFKNLGQFVSAVNASSNLSIPFPQLKAKMVENHQTLGQAIQALKPAASGSVEAQRAEYDARGLILEAEQAQAAKTTSAAKPKKSAEGGSQH